MKDKRKKKYMWDIWYVFKICTLNKSPAITLTTNSLDIIQWNLNNYLCQFYPSHKHSKWENISSFLTIFAKKDPLLFNSGLLVLKTSTRVSLAFILKCIYPTSVTITINFHILLMLFFFIVKFISGSQLEDLEAFWFYCILYQATSYELLILLL